MNDDELLDDLGAAMRARASVPPGFLAAGRAAFAWRTVDAELAALAFDSAETGGVLSGTRADDAALRALTFATATLTVELEVGEDGLLGQLVPPQTGEVRVERRDGPPVTVTADDVGWFVVRPVPAGLVRLHVTAAEGGTVVTPWTTL
ncbi:MAG TPA: hypothetical protein VGD67_24740 [Pseudonocardiaceae bacterium]